MSRYSSLGAVVVLSLVTLSCSDAPDPLQTAPDHSEHLAPAAPSAARLGKVGGFVALLDGAQEVPAVMTKARGAAHFQLSKDGTEVTYWLFVADIENVTMAHIHLAPPGENGPVVVWLYPDAPPPQLIEGSFTGVLATGTFGADDLVGPLAGRSLADLMGELGPQDAYVNVHTTAYPAGEIRGQISVLGAR